MRRAFAPLIRRLRPIIPPGRQSRHLGVALLGLCLAGCQGSLVFPHHLAVNRLTPAQFNGLQPPPLRVPLCASFAWFFPSESSGPTLMIFHGNAETVDDYAPWASRLARHGLSVLLIEFPGYRETGGRSTPGSLRRVATAGYDWLRSSRNASGKIAVLGRSIGAAVACDLVQARPVETLILISPFTSLADAARSAHLPGFAALGRFDNRKALEGYTGDLLVIHGNRDAILPITLGRELYEATPTPAPRKRFVELDAGHNDLIPIYEARLTEEIVRFVLTASHATEPSSGLSTRAPR